MRSIDLRSRGVSNQVIESLVYNRDAFEIFWAVLDEGADPKFAANWTANVVAPALVTGEDIPERQWERLREHLAERRRQ